MTRKGQLGRNIGANFLARSWAGILWLILVPIYLQLLGSSAYGLVGLYLSLSLVMQLFDFGLSPTVTRELARAGALQTDFAHVRNLLATAELVSWSTATTIGLGLFLAVKLTNGAWIHSIELEPDQIHRALLLAALAIATQWPALYYGGALSGLHRQTWLGGISILFTTLRGAGAAFVLWQLSATADAFFLWHAACSVIQALTLAAALRFATPVELRRGSIRIASLLEVRHFAAGMSLLGLLAVIVTQTDKLLLSAWLPLDQYGFYIAAAALATIPQYIAAPVAAALLPELSGRLASGDHPASIVVYRRATAWVALILGAATAPMILLAHPVLLAWSGNPILAREAGLALSMLAAGGSLNGIMHIPYTWQIARGRPQIPVRINVTSLCVMLPTLWYGARHFGPAGAAFAWLAFNLCYIIINLRFMLIFAPETRPIENLVKDILRPWSASLIACLIVAQLPLPGSRLLLTAALVGTMLLSALAGFFNSPTCIVDVKAWLDTRRPR